MDGRTGTEGSTVVTNVVGIDKLIKLAEAQVKLLESIEARLARLEALQGPAEPETSPKPRKAG